MRLHSNIITAAHIYQALETTGLSAEGVYAETITTGSRSALRGITLKLSTYGGKDRYGVTRRHSNPGTGGRWASENPERAATWDEWGILLAALYDIDPDLNATYYTSQADFWATTAQHKPTNATAPWLDES